MNRTTVQNRLAASLSFLSFFSKNRSISLLTVLFSGGVLSGALTVKYGSQGLIDSLNLLVAGGVAKRGERLFSDVFLSSFAPNFLFLLAAFVFGFCAVGAPIVAFVAFTKGLSIGVTVSYLYSACGTKGIEYSLLSIIPAGLVSSFSIIAACAASFGFSRLYFSMFSNSVDSKQLFDRCMSYLSKYIVFSLLLFVAAIIDAVLCRMFGTVF